jgi:hypothetical protein
MHILSDPETAMPRIHVLIDEADKARFRRQAEREGKSLGAWLREAAEEKLSNVSASRRIESVEDLDAFFAECDHREVRPEPEWADHRKVIDRSRSAGLDVT